MTTTTTTSRDHPPTGEEEEEEEEEAKEKGGDAVEGRTISTSSGDAAAQGNFQDIDAFKGEVLNRAELAAFACPSRSRSCRCLHSVDPRRLAVAFRKLRVTPGSLPTLTIPLGWVNDGRGPEGLDTTYLTT